MVVTIEVYISTLDAVMRALQADDRIVIHNVSKDTDLFRPSEEGWAQTVDIAIWPKVGVYDADLLNDLLIGLIPAGIRPDYAEYFRDDCRMLYFGRLHYEEVIGERCNCSHIVLFDRELAAQEGIEGSVKEASSIREIGRRTRLTLYPSKEVAELYYPPEGMKVVDRHGLAQENGIDLELLKEIQFGSFAQSAYLVYDASNPDKPKRRLLPALVFITTLVLAFAGLLYFFGPRQ